MGVKQHPSLKTFVVDLLQGDRSALYGVELVFSLREKPEVGYDHSCTYFLTSNFPVEIDYYGEYHFRDFREKLSVVAEEHP
jgi:hypothetical protein